MTDLPEGPFHKQRKTDLTSPLRRLWNELLGLFGETPSSDDELIYAPVHVAGVIVGCLTALGVLFWLLWALLVCEGGIFVKVIPFLQVVFTSKTLRDFGYEGYPYQLGIFEGWVVNVAALVIGIALSAALWWIFKVTDRRKKSRSS